MTARTSIPTLFALGLATSSSAAAAPPGDIQVRQVAQWFSGSFDNAAQVAQDPRIPAISMSTCAVMVEGLGPEAYTLHLEQFVAGSPAPLRVALYVFRPGEEGVELAVRRYADQSALLGLCDRAPAERVIPAAGLVPGSCNLGLTWQQEAYVASNAPDGCPTASGGRVISDAIIRASGTDSLDRIYDAQGNLVWGTSIEFRRLDD
jgi:hypothetical protein